MHTAQVEFCTWVAARHPAHFTGKRVLDAGSMDINGNNRYLFTDCEYTGIDVGPGPNVDLVVPVHEHSGEYDTVISTEMLEHDRHWRLSLARMVELSQQFLIFTCAAPGRPEHGTTRTTPGDAPHTNDYYRNLSEEDVRGVIDFSQFREYCLRQVGNDLYCYALR